MVRVVTYSVTVSCLLSMHVHNSCIPAVSSTISAPYLHQDPSYFYLALFPVICCKNPVFTPSSFFPTEGVRTHVYSPKSITAFTNAQ